MKVMRMILFLVFFAPSLAMAGANVPAEALLSVDADGIATGICSMSVGKNTTSDYGYCKAVIVSQKGVSGVSPYFPEYVEIGIKNSTAAYDAQGVYGAICAFMLKSSDPVKIKEYEDIKASVRGLNSMSSFKVTMGPVYSVDPRHYNGKQIWRDCQWVGDFEWNSRYNN